MGVLLLISLVLVIAGIGPWFISRKTYRSLKKHESDWPVFISVLVFLVSFAIIVAGILWVIVSTFRFER